jgi:hypothetical protein
MSPFASLLFVYFRRGRERVGDDGVLIIGHPQSPGWPIRSASKPDLITLDYPSV